MPEKEHIAVYVNPALSLSLPLRTGPLRFAVINKNGLSSNSWRVWVEQGKEVYIGCRDSMHEVHISLHQSGQQHVRFRNQATRKSAVAEQWGSWREPPAYGRPDIAPSFRLYFPNWALALTEPMRQSDPGKWDTNHLWIETHDRNPETEVGFYIIDADVNLRFDDAVLSDPIAVLPLLKRANKTLWVIVTQRPEGDLKQVVQSAIDQINKESSLLADHNDLQDGELLSLLLNGTTDYGSGFGIVVPVDLHKNEKSR